MIRWMLRGTMGMRGGRCFLSVLALGAVVGLMGGCGPVQTPVISEFADAPGPGAEEGTAPPEATEAAATASPTATEEQEDPPAGSPVDDAERERLVWEAFDASLGISVIEDRSDEEAIVYDWDAAWLAGVELQEDNVLRMTEWRKEGNECGDSTSGFPDCGPILINLNPWALA